MVSLLTHFFFFCFRFFTTAAALRAKRGFFRALCDGVGCAKKDSEGSIFIDRSPLAFRFVLNHLRGEPIDLGNSSDDSTARFF